MRSITPITAEDVEQRESHQPAPVVVGSLDAAPTSSTYTYLTTQTIQDENQRPIARFGSLEDGRIDLPPSSHPGVTKEAILDRDSSADGAQPRRPRSSSGNDADPNVSKWEDGWDRLEYEFRLENVKYNGNYPHTYGRLNWIVAFGEAGSGCCCCSVRRGNDVVAVRRPIASPWVWLAWKVFLMLALVGEFVYSISVAYDDGQFFYFVSNWQTTLFALYSVVSLIATIWVQFNFRQWLQREQRDSDFLIGAAPESHARYHMPWICRVAWFLENLCLVTGIWVSLLFWTGAMANQVDLSPGYFVDHLVTTLIIIIDFSVSSLPWPLFQCAWASMFVVIYMIWTIIHYKLKLGNKFDDGIYIYPVLDWSKPVRTFFLYAFLIFAGIPLISTGIWWSSSSARGKWWPGRYVPWAIAARPPDIGYREPLMSSVSFSDRDRLG